MDFFRMLATWTLAILVSLPQASLSFKTHPYSLTTTGAVRGSRVKVLEREVHSFLGIPFAEPPLEELRFAKPVPVTPWDGIFDATEPAAPCMQRTTVPGPWSPPDDIVTEDCLYLNVWVPGTQENKDDKTLPKAVMVWIHGGGYTIGASSLDFYNGETLAAVGDVIVASMNYRLGIFGFLNAEIEDAPGNMGMYDQVLALRWIKENIESFGGDPERITIFGESAGSMSVGLHLLSPLSHGLFNRAIMQSGSPNHPEWGGESSCSGPVRGDRVAKAIGCSDDTRSLATHPRDVVECLKKTDSLVLTEAEFSVYQKCLQHFVPSFGDDFMPVPPMAAVRDKKFNRTQLLAGVTSGEGFLILGIMHPEVFTDAFENVIDSLKDSQRQFFKKLSKPTASEIHKEYFEGKDVTNEEEFVVTLAASFGDYELTCPTVVQSDSAAQAGSPVFFYYVDHHPSNSPLKPWMGMNHFEEVQFVFGLPLRNPSAYTKEEQQFSRTLMDIWINFAKTGKPHYSEDKPWPEFHPDREYVHLKPNYHKVLKGPHLDHCNFWKDYLV